MHAPPSLDEQHAQALLSSAQAGLEVQRRHQFFVWTQGLLQALLPHHLAACGAYSRAHHELQFEAFNAVPLDAHLLATLADTHGALLRRLQEMWLRARCKPVSLDLETALQHEAHAEPCPQLQAAGFAELLAHGVSRPQRPNEIETFFVLGRRGARYSPHHKQSLELLMPHLHSTWQRVQAVERELREPVTATPSRAATGVQITERERQILHWLREGCSNPQIGETLGISALTVKNHVQKILRKLGAANRAHAVAIAIGRHLLSGPPGPAN